VGDAVIRLPQEDLMVLVVALRGALGLCGQGACGCYAGWCAGQVHMCHGECTGAYHYSIDFIWTCQPLAHAVWPLLRATRQLQGCATAVLQVHTDYFLLAVWYEGAPGHHSCRFVQRTPVI
jgi:hypothetical protein